VVRRHRLRGNHGFDLVGRLECLKALDRHEHLPGAILVRYAGREPAGLYHCVDQGGVEPIAL
jgi:hypothetical protein